MRVFAILALALAAFGCGTRSGLRVEDAWVRSAPAHAATAAYFTIVNVSPRALVLLAVSAAVADSASLHETLAEGGRMQMRAIGRLAIPAHGRARFAPGARHVMLSGLHAALAPGARVVLVLRFADGRRDSVAASVRD